MVGNDLPETSKGKYQRAYATFMSWKSSNKIVDISENVIISYFKELSQTHKPTSSLAYYCMLKATLKINNNVDISTYRKLAAYLKDKCSAYKPLKGRTFTRRQVDKFIFNAPDSKWLDVKVACIFGVCGALSVDDLTNLRIDNIEKHSDLLLVRTNNVKQSRTFTITGKYCDVVQKYFDLRPPKTVEKRFFVNYREERCTVQVIGKHKFGKMGERIATYLHLPEPRRYNGNTFRRSSLDRERNYGTWQSAAESPAHKIDTDDDSAQSPTTSATITAKQTNLTFDSQIDMIKSEPFDDTNDSIVVKSEQFDEEMCDTNEVADWLTSSQLNTANNVGNGFDGTGRTYECEKCGHMNTIAPPSSQNGFFDSSKSVENSAAFHVSIDPLSLELQNHPVSSQSNICDKS